MPDNQFPGPGGKTVNVCHNCVKVHCPADATKPRDLTYEFEGRFYKRYDKQCHVLTDDGWVVVAWKDVHKYLKSAMEKSGSAKRRKHWPQIVFPPKTPKLEVVQPKKTGKTCEICKLDSVQVMTRRELSDYFEEIIEDNAGYGLMHGYTDKEIDDYIAEARQNKRKIMAYFDSHEKPVFGWDVTTELPVIL